MAAFDNYRKLKKVVLPENITEIPNGFFYHSSIENIEIPRSVEKIGEFAFYNSNIKKLVVYENVKSIEKYAFRWCYNLEEVEFKEGIEELGNNIFEDCNKLTTITLPSTIKSIAFDCFNLSSIRTVRINKDKSEFGKEDSEDWGLSSGSQIIWNDQTETIQ